MGEGGKTYDVFRLNLGLRDLFPGIVLLFKILILEECVACFGSQHERARECQMFGPDRTSKLASEIVHRLDYSGGPPTRFHEV